MKIEDVEAVTVGVPNPGHSLVQLECSADSLCVDTTNNRVGIGTANPSSKLHVIGTIQSDWDTSTSNISQLYLRRLSGGVFDGTSFTTDVGMGMGQVNLVSGASLGNGGYVYNGTRGATRISLGDGIMSFFTGTLLGTGGQTAGTAVAWSNGENAAMVIDNIGNVGIGTTTPNFKLDVAGDVNITGQIYMGCPTGWVDSGYGFCVMQYEARNVSGVATSTASSTPWTWVSQTQAAAACSALGNGAHLITNAEWMILARDIESVSSNWSSGTVGSGNLARGWTANLSYGDTWTNNAFAPSTGSTCLYNTGADTCGASGTFLYRRTHTLSNGQTIWDLSGNVSEWTHDICTTGTGTGYWQGAGWVEWTDSSLSDYEKITAGPIGTYTATNAVGRYYGCSANGNGFLRGEYWADGSYVGLFSLYLNAAPSYSNSTIGFRCAR